MSHENDKELIAEPTVEASVSAGSKHRVPNSKRKNILRAIGGALGLIVAIVGIFVLLFGKVAPEAPRLVSFGEDNAAICIDFTDRGFKCGVTWRSDEELDRGSLISQSIEAGSFVGPTAPVELVYSSGPAKVTVPTVAGLPLDEAQELLYSRGLTVELIEEVAGEGLEPGRVVRLSENEGEELPSGTVVTLYVASSDQVAPEWAGSTRAAVEAEALKLGIELTVTEEVSEASAGEVLSQTPAAGEPLGESGVSVTVAINEEEAPLEVLDVIGSGGADAEVALAEAGFRNITTVVVKTSQVTEAQVTQVVPEVGATITPDSLLVLIVSEPE